MSALRAHILEQPRKLVIARRASTLRETRPPPLRDVLRTREPEANRQRRDQQPEKCRRYGAPRHARKIDLRGLDGAPDGDFPEVIPVCEIAEPDAVIHLAAQSHVPSAWENPERTWRINVIGTLNIMRACQAQRSAPRMLFISSGEVYGKPQSLPMGEDHPLRPQNPYAASKVAGEALVRQMSDEREPGLLTRVFDAA